MNAHCPYYQYTVVTLNISRWYRTPWMKPWLSHFLMIFCFIPRTGSYVCSWYWGCYIAEDDSWCSVSTSQMELQTTKPGLLSVSLWGGGWHGIMTHSLSDKEKAKNCSSMLPSTTRHSSDKLLLFSWIWKIMLKTQWFLNEQLHICKGGHGCYTAFLGPGR